MIVEELAAKLGLEIDSAAWERAAAAVEGLKAGLGAVGAAAAALGGILVGIVKTTADAAIEASKTAQKVGTSATAWQELSFAAQQSNVAVESLEHGLVHMSRHVFEASQGSAEAGYTFRQLGVSLHDARGNIRPTDKILGDLAERFARMPDGVTKTAQATKVFGRAGFELIPFLNKGRKGIDELRQAAHDYGVVIDDEAIAAAKRWQQQQLHLVAALRGLRNAIGVRLLKLMGDLTDRIADWIRLNRELIAGGVITFLQKMAQLAEPILKIFDELFIKTEAWKYSLVVLAAILAAMNLPLLGIVFALLAIEDFYGFLEGKDSVIGAIFGDKETRDEIRAFFDHVRDVLKYIFSGQLGDDLANPGSSAITGIAKALGIKQGGGYQAAVDAGIVSPVENPSAYLPPLVGPSSTQVGGNRVHIEQHIHAQPGQSTKEIADESAAKIDDVLQRLKSEGYAATDQ